MSGIDLSAAIEAAARANYERHFIGGLAWGPLGIERQESARQIVRPVVTAAAPLIETAVREQTVREIEARMDQADAQGSTDFSEGFWSGLNEAKHMVARGEQR